WLAGIVGAGDGGGPGGFGGGDTLNGSNTGGGGAGMGGAVFNLFGTVTILNSTLSQNVASGGSGGGSADSPSSKNGQSGSGFGGGVFNLNGVVNVVNSTLAGNGVGYALGAGAPGQMSGAAVYCIAMGLTPEGGQAAATVNLGNSILTSSNPAVPAVASFPAYGPTTINAIGPNLLSNVPVEVRDAAVNDDQAATYAVRSYRASGAADLLATSSAPRSYTGVRFLVADPRLGALGTNGGQASTRALLPRSPAIGRGSNRLAAAYGLETDARGPGFQRRVGRSVDLGAFEFHPGAGPRFARRPGALR
uniref:choice-of-anchor Q domain-containing protein n=1 Tax=Paludisphaera soli TaxID=2712865 RepID=UPI0028F3EE27